MSIEAFARRNMGRRRGGRGRGSGLRRQTDLFDSSNIPARAQYHAANADSKLKKPAVLIIGGFGPPLASRCKYPIPSNKNEISSVKKMKKNATVERSVAMRRRVVNMNQP